MRRAILVAVLAGWTSAFVVKVLSDPVAAADKGLNPQAAGVASGDGAAILRARCLVCHGSELIAQQRLDADGWSREVEKMVGWGATVESGEREVLVRYLASLSGLRRGNAVTDDALPLVKARCSACHDSSLIAQQRLDVDGWSRELDKMIGWGATLTESEKVELASLLGRGHRKP